NGTFTSCLWELLKYEGKVITAFSTEYLWMDEAALFRCAMINVNISTGLMFLDSPLCATCK
ncbi:hypothetical protein PENTCL1PPCAC_21158, partial [Pristionchus entomophagus]